MDSDLDEARKRIENIASHLPTSISVASLGVLSKAPYLLLSTREALIWRTEELARCACDMLERNDVATGILPSVGGYQAAHWYPQQRRQWRHPQPHRPLASARLHRSAAAHRRVLPKWERVPRSARS